MATLAVGLALLVGALVMGLVAMTRREGPGDLGSVSRTWIIENRIDHHDRG